MALSVKEGLVAARDLLAQPGVWTKRPSVDGQHCASTAVSVQFNDGDEQAWRNLVEARKVFMKSIGAPGHANALYEVYKWNDAEERTLEDVLAAYDRAIEAAS